MKGFTVWMRDNIFYLLNCNLKTQSEIFIALVISFDQVFNTSWPINLNIFEIVCNNWLLKEIPLTITRISILGKIKHDTVWNAWIWFRSVVS